MQYISLAEVTTFMGVSGEDELLTMLINMAESFLHTELRVETLDTTTYTEDYEGKYLFDRNYDRHTYVLKNLNPTSLVSINGTAVTSEQYTLEGRLLVLDVSYTLNKWGKVAFEYVAGYDSIPQDIKTLLLYVVSGLYNARKGVGIKSFTQGQLTVSYNSQAEVDMFSGMYKKTLKKYKKNDILTTA